MIQEYFQLVCPHAAVRLARTYLLLNTVILQPETGRLKVSDMWANVLTRAAELGPITLASTSSGPPPSDEPSGYEAL